MLQWKPRLGVLLAVLGVLAAALGYGDFFVEYGDVVSDWESYGW